MLGVGRIHPAVNVPAFTSFTATDSGGGLASVSWVAVRTTSVVVRKSDGTVVASGGASGTQGSIAQGYGTSETYTATAIASSGGVATAVSSLNISVGPAPVFTSYSAAPSALNIVLNWVCTNTSTVLVYLCDAQYTPVTLLGTKAATDTSTYVGGQYATTYYFLLKALGTQGANDTIVRISASTQPYTPSDHIYVYTGSPETFVVPPGVTSIQVKSWGSQGGSAVGAYGTYPGGEGGYVYTTVPVTPGETLTVKVGGRGGYNAASPYGGLGGGSGTPLYTVIGPYGHADGTAGSGGGATGLYRGSTPLAVAGGGGGSGTEVYVEAGHGSPGVAALAAAGGLGGVFQDAIYLTISIIYNFVETGPGMGYGESTPTSIGGSGGVNLSSEYSQQGGRLGDGLLILHY